MCYEQLFEVRLPARRLKEYDHFHWAEGVLTCSDCLYEVTYMSEISMEFYCIKRCALHAWIQPRKCYFLIASQKDVVIVKRAGTD